MRKTKMAIPLYILISLKDDGALLGILLLQNADPSIINNKGETPLHIVALNGSVDAARSLCLYNIDINAKTLE